MGNGNHMSIPTPWGTITVTGGILVLAIALVVVLLGGFTILDRGHEQLDRSLDKLLKKTEVNVNLQFATCMGVGQTADDKERCVRIYNAQGRGVSVP